LVFGIHITGHSLSFWSDTLLPLLPTDWSAAISFVDSAAQEFVVLMSMFTIPDVKTKVD